jgi:hypothetical protein
MKSETQEILYEGSPMGNSDVVTLGNHTGTGGVATPMNTGMDEIKKTHYHLVRGFVGLLLELGVIETTPMDSSIG